ncbi:5-formyltetrahydrofolate cyclo-ligase-like [Dreissena polymorpha]|nr:5-formyltetrahydrofolate cyclo-ligase-like [Dreissena polymorpha]XP_052278349.1 5-formyltetrahydrofolate cyclo-ligase-like [Dreissena polymorpha]
MTASARYHAKAALRKELKRRLANMADCDRERESNGVTQKVLELKEFSASRRVSLYLNMKEEVHTSAIMKHVLETGKECFIPQYIGTVMKMVKLNSLADYEALPETKWKIKQPADDDHRPDALETGGLDLILMPGLGFTRAGDRIGRGKGYYDSYLSKCEANGCKPVTVALAYREQICDEIPVTQNDKKVDHVIYLE